jgi:hypothetical protein
MRGGARARRRVRPEPPDVMATRGSPRTGEPTGAPREATRVRTRDGSLPASINPRAETRGSERSSQRFRRWSRLRSVMARKRRSPSVRPPRAARPHHIKSSQPCKFQGPSRTSTSSSTRQAIESRARGIGQSVQRLLGSWIMCDIRMPRLSDSTEVGTILKRSLSDARGGDSVAVGETIAVIGSGAGSGKDSPRVTRMSWAFPVDVQTVAARGYNRLEAASRQVAEAHPDRRTRRSRAWRSGRLTTAGLNPSRSARVGSHGEHVVDRRRARREYREENHMEPDRHRMLGVGLGEARTRLSPGCGTAARTGPCMQALDGGTTVDRVMPLW